MLWPYRSSALRNQKPFTFGDVDADRPLRRAQVLLEGGDPAAVDAVMRYLDETGVEHEIAADCTAVAIAPDLHRLTVEIRSDGAVMRGSHAILRTSSGGFVSATDPPEPLRAQAEACEHDGLWPVLVGEPGARDVMLCTPIILEDHPRIAPESPGDLFDGGEIDGLLTLSILALTDEEKAEIRAGDPRARAVLERTEALTDEQKLRLYGFRSERP
jgi:hypothetical protein